MLERVPIPVSRIAASLWLLAAGLVGQVALAGGRSASVTVSATVAPYIRASADGQPVNLAITDEDIERGFIDVPDAGFLGLQTNNPAGTTLLLSLERGPVSWVEVMAAGSSRTIGSAGGWLDIPFNGTARQRLQLSCRLFLSDDAQPGIVPWPLGVDARMNGARTAKLPIACMSCSKPSAGAGRIASLK